MKSVNNIAESIKQFADSPSVNDRGNTVYRGTAHFGCHRYLVDFADDFKAEGWLQFDTDQDASYFGVWVNPTSRRTLTYCEGDWTLVECPTSASYNAEIDDACQFYGEGFIFRAYELGRRPRCDEYRQDRSQFLIPVS
jgi:hypothetical protein